MKFQKGEKVIVNGSDGIVLNQYTNATYEVRLFDGYCIIGVICVDERDILKVEE